MEEQPRPDYWEVTYKGDFQQGVGWEVREGMWSGNNRILELERILENSNQTLTFQGQIRLFKGASLPSDTDSFSCFTWEKSLCVTSSEWLPQKTYPRTGCRRRPSQMSSAHSHCKGLRNHLCPCATSINPPGIWNLTIKEPGFVNLVVLLLLWLVFKST